MPDKVLRQRAGGGHLPGHFGSLSAGMAPGVRLLAALLLGMLVVPAVTACGSSGSPCDIVSRMNGVEIKITGPNVNGCGGLHKQVSTWQYFGLGISWQYGAPAPTGAPACTVTSGDQTWSFYGVGSEGGASFDCRMVKTKRGLLLWQAGQQAG